MTNSAVIMFIIIAIPLSVLNGTILSRTTFEEWEGSISDAGWTITIGGNGDIAKGAENGDPDSYETQAHGKWSLHLNDPDCSDSRKLDT
jgi:hypothetical protein